jgi:NitT/TauT family transport system permease protein
VIVPGVQSIGVRLQTGRDLNDSVLLLETMIVILVIGIVVDSLLFGTVERALRRRRGLLER